MAKQWQIRRGSASDNRSFIGAEGEITLDLDSNILHIHDGNTQGGITVPSNADVVHTSGDETIEGYKSFVDCPRFKTNLTPSTNTPKSETIENNLVNVSLNTDGLVDGMNIVRAQNTDGSREVWYRAGFRKIPESTDPEVNNNLWPSVRVGVTPDNYTYADLRSNTYAYAPTPKTFSDNTEIATTWWVKDHIKLNLTELPVGTIIPYAGDTAPDGWLICDGSERSRGGNTARLFAAIGTKYGEGDGSTSFNLPNLKDRVPVMSPLCNNDGTSGDGWVPNITGTLSGTRVSGTSISGVFLQDKLGSDYGSGNDFVRINQQSFDASRCSDVYQNDKTTVLPAYTHTLYIIKYKDASDEKEDLLNLIYPVGSLYMGIQSTCPLLTLMPHSTWELVGTKLLVGVDDNIPVKGNGMTIGVTNGTENAGLKNGTGATRTFADVSVYGSDIGTTTASGATLGDNISIGITTDGTKSGIIADLSNSKTEITVNIFRRTM